MIEHISSGLTLLEQKNLVKLFLCIKSKFYQPKLKMGSKMNLQMCCLGKHWNPKDYNYYHSRTDFDDLECPPVPQYLVSLAQKFAKPNFSQVNFDWDICIINWYQENNKLGLHRDDSESSQTLSSGHPVVSFSVGAPSKFLVGGLQKSDTKATHDLMSGDVFLFGNEHRLIYHGIQSIDASPNNPFSTWLNNGRLNFTLRKY